MLFCSGLTCLDLKSPGICAFPFPFQLSWGSGALDSAYEDDLEFDCGLVSDSAQEPGRHLVPDPRLEFVISKRSLIEPSASV